MEFFLEEDIDYIYKSLGRKPKTLEGKKILISGGAGFLGTYFTEVIARYNKTLFKKPCKIFILDKFIDKKKKILLKKNSFDFKVHDVSKKINLSQKFDYIIHAAGIPTPSEYKVRPIDTLDVSYLGTRFLLDVAKKMKAKFIFFSSSEIYGNPDKKNIPTKEDYRGYVSSIGGRSCYDEGKRVGETLSYTYYERFGIHTNCIRPFNVYGPGMLRTDYRVLPNFALNILMKKPLRVFYPGTQTRTYCYVTDAIIGFFLVFLKGSPGEIYNIGNNKPEVTVFELANKVKNNLDTKVKIKIMKYPKDYPDEEPERRCPDLKKSKTQLGYYPKINLDEGLTKFFDWSFKNYKI